MAGGGTIFTAGIVLAVMILPIITAVTREVFVQTPRGQIEAALALGATRWEVVRTTVLPFGLSGYISGADAGPRPCARRDHRPADHPARHPDRVRLVAVRRRLHLRQQDRRGRQANSTTSTRRARYIAAGLVLFILTFVVNSRGAAPRVAGRGGRIMTSTLDRPVKAPTFQGVSAAPQGHQQGRDRAGHAVGADRDGAAGVGAATRCIAEGHRRDHCRATWWTNSQAGMTAFAAGRRRLPRHRRHACCRRSIVRVISIPIGILVAIYLVEYGGGTRLGKITTFMVDILTGVPSIVAALFIYALWVATLGFQRSRLRGVTGLGAVDDSGHRACHRGDAAHRPDGPARGELRARACPSGRPSSAIVIPTALSGIVTGIMLALARVMGETAPLLILVGYAQADELRHVRRASWARCPA